LPGLVSMTRTLSMPIPGVTPRPSEQTKPALPPAPAVKAQKADITKSAPPVSIAKHAGRTVAPKYKQTPTSPRHKQIASAIRYANKRLPAAEANLYAAHIMDASKRFSMNPAIVTGVMLIESRGNRFAVSKAGALGLMQIMWNVHERSLKKKFPEIETRSDMFEARNSIMAGTWILKGHLERNNNDLSAALGRYLGMRSSYYHNQVLTYANMAGYNKEWDLEN
ncbi:MAG: transglycosylase SLT domain-containing protein, partial [Synergistaceae bacterium]|nr:transglycosylase SLT domain-containing protein [Synergistaceae bacterium]